MDPLLLAIDQGTTSTRAILFAADGTIRGQAARALPCRFPADGWVEQDAWEIWEQVLAVVPEALAAAGVTAASVTALGVTNQRETTVLWDRATGRPLAPAIVWQDRRTAAQCASLIAQGAEPRVQERTGLVIDPYFSASKIAWLLDQVPGARARATTGGIACGTIDSWLRWQLSGGTVHATDATNACRTLLFDLHRQAWDEALLALWRVPASVLPQVTDCAGALGSTTCLGARIPLTGAVGDQQAAAIGQACLQPGQVKATFGTGCFVLAHAGRTVPRSRHRLLATIAWRIAGETAYALEGAVFQAGTVVQWLRDQLHAVPTAAASAAVAQGADPASEVEFVPAFTGLGAPWWDPRARGAIVGLTRATSLADIVQAGLSGVAWQVTDLLTAMAQDGLHPQELRVDGGMAGNRHFLQLLADRTGVVARRPAVLDTTAWGAAVLAGVGAGVFPDLAAAGARWTAVEEARPQWDAARRAHGHARWRAAVARVRSAPNDFPA